MNVKQVLRRDGMILIMSFKNAIAWRVSMMFSIISGPLVIFANYAVWGGIFAASKSSTIGGFTFEGLMIYITISALLFYLIWDDLDYTLQDSVREGTLIKYLLRPVSFFWSEFIAKIGHRILALILEFIPALFVVYLFIGNTVLEGHFGWFAAFVVIAFTISFLIHALLGMLAFYFTKPRGMIQIYSVVSGLLYGAFLPLSMLPKIVQKISFFLPFQFVGFVPAQMFIGNYTLGGIVMTPGQLILYGLLHCAILLIIVVLLWRHSVKRFCGVGV